MANEKRHDWMAMLGLALSILAIILIVSKGGSQEFILQQSESNTLSVSGNAEMMFDPNKADIYVRVETREDDAQKVQSENRIISSDVLAALDNLGIDEDQIETTEYRLDRVQEYDTETRKMETNGYKLVNVMKVTTEELDEVGNIIDVVVEAGANGVDQVQFGLTDSRMQEARDMVLEKASLLAQEKAESMADHLKVRLGSPTRVTENQYDYVPFAVAESAVLRMDDAGASTKVSPQQVEIRTRVNVDYNIN